MHGGTAEGEERPASGTADGRPGRLVQGWQARRIECPILAEQREPRQASTQLGVEPRPCDPCPELAVTDGADVYAVCVCEIALVVSLDLASEHQVRVFGNPFELAAHAEAACFDMELRIGSGSRVGQQERKRKVVAAESGTAAGGRVFHRAGFEEPVQLHTRSAAQLNVGHPPDLFWNVKQQN